MSTKEGKIRNHRFHGDPNRFQVVSDYIAENYTGRVKRIADVAGGQGMLCRILKKRYNFECEVIDPRGYTLVGVKNRAEGFKADMADYYDLVVGLHPDEALKDVVYSALVRPVILIPCCNFWTKEKKLGRDALLSEIEAFYKQHRVNYKKVTFDFEGPKNIGLVSEPPKGESTDMDEKVIKQPTEYEKFLAEKHSKFATSAEVIDEAVKNATQSLPLNKTRLVVGEVNEVYGVETESGRQVMVRINREDEMPFEKEDWAIKKCLEAALPVPEILAIEHLKLEGKNASLCVQRRLEGETLDKVMDAKKVDEKTLEHIIRDAGKFLSDLHTIKTEGFGPVEPEGNGRYKTWDEWMWRVEEEAEKDKGTIQKHGLNPGLVNQALVILRKYQHQFREKNSVLLHWDYHPKHIMVHNGKFNGVIDWGNTSSGSPFMDFSWWAFFGGSEDRIPLKQLLEGYKDKSIFNDNFDLKLHYYKLRLGLIMIYYYNQTQHYLGLNHSLEMFQKDLDFLKSLEI